MIYEPSDLIFIICIDLQTDFIDIKETFGQKMLDGFFCLICTFSSCEI